MKTNIIQLGSRSLAIQSLPAVQADLVPVAVNHLIVIDISGSMYNDLPELRLQLKNKLATLVQEQDTVSILWFSGRGQYGVVVEALEIRNIADLSDLHQAIDRYLKPMGLTGFREPLQEVGAVIARISAKRPNGLFSLFFMTDGYDNQWRDAEILDVCKALESKLSNAVIVEWQNGIRSIPFVPETMAAHKLMRIFKQQKRSLAVVVDEFGGVSGIVALEDLIEEILGDIEDEHDTTSIVAKQISDNEYIFSGRIDIEKANETFGLNLPESENYQTIGGLILNECQSIPKVNDVIQTENFTFKIIKVSANKIELVKLFTTK
jgi:hypothetical protein